MPNLQPTIYDLDDEERDTLHHAMTVVDNMTPDEQRWLITNTLATAIYHQRNPDTAVLEDFIRNVRATIRLHASPHYKKVATSSDSAEPDPTRPSWDVEEALSTLPE